MTSGPKIAEIASLVGDPSRANILAALMDGRALSASELAYAAHVTAQTTSLHLAKLTQAGLLAETKQGRHRYFRLASPLVARMLEGIMAMASPEPQPRRTSWRGGEALRQARTCYDHLAGRLGVALADALSERGHLVLTEDGGEVTSSGQTFLAGLGVQDNPTATRSRRMFCRPCLDWSERRPHLAGQLGAALCTRCFDLGWIERQRDGRSLIITPTGRNGFAAVFGIDPAP